MQTATIARPSGAEHRVPFHPWYRPAGVGSFTWNTVLLRTGQGGPSSMIVRVAVVGSRGYPRLNLVADLISRLHGYDPEGFEILSGIEPGTRGRGTWGTSKAM